jgi:hypothetical protein
MEARWADGKPYRLNNERYVDYGERQIIIFCNSDFNLMSDNRMWMFSRSKLYPTCLSKIPDVLAVQSWHGVKVQTESSA